MKIFPSVFLVLLSFTLGARPRPVIFDTDWWTDVDDACAVRVLKTLENKGDVKLEGVCLSALNSTSVCSLGAFLAHEGFGDVPVGADKEAVDFNGRPCYHKLMIEGLPSGKYSSIDDCEDCVEFYRSLLASSRRKVDIIAVGYPNALARLLESPPDAISPLDGKALVKRKVRHLWMMAGKYPQGLENNFKRTPRSRKAGALLCSCWPGRITFLGWEVGADVLAGGCLPDTDILKKALVAHKDPNGRSAWDPMTVVLASCGKSSKAGYSEVRGTVAVDPETGKNVFIPSPSGKHSYVIKKFSDSYYSGRIDSMLVR